MNVFVNNIQFNYEYRDAGNNAPLNTYCLVRRKHPAAGTPVLFPYIAQTGPAVHPAGSNQRWVKFYPIDHVIVLCLVKDYPITTLTLCSLLSPKTGITLDD